MLLPSLIVYFMQKKAQNSGHKLYFNPINDTNMYIMNMHSHNNKISDSILAFFIKNSLKAKLKFLIEKYAKKTKSARQLL